MAATNPIILFFIHKCKDIKWDCGGAYLLFYATRRNQPLRSSRDSHHGSATTLKQPTPPLRLSKRTRSQALCHSGTEVASERTIRSPDEVAIPSVFASTHQQTISPTRTPQAQVHAHAQIEQTPSGGALVSLCAAARRW